MKIVDWISTSRSVLIYTDNPSSEIAKSTIYVDNTLLSATNPNNSSTIWFQLINDTYVQGRAIVRVNNLNTGVCYNITGTIFTDPSIEFWKTDFEPAVLDKSISGGNWANGQISNARDTATADIVIDGDKFMSPYSDYAPEEFVPGHTTDSLGIEVYTRENETYGTMISGAIPVIAGTTVTQQISIIQEAIGGFFLTFNNKIFNRYTSTNFTTSNQFYIQGKSIIMPPQEVSGYAGYSMIKIGGVGLIDSNSVFITHTATNNFSILGSLMSYDDLRYVYVLDNGQEVKQITTSTDSGYMIEREWDKTIIDDTQSQSYRASLHFYNLTLGDHLLEAWFFDTEEVRFNRIFENYYTIDNSQTIELLKVPGSWQPYSDKAIVEIGLGLGNTVRKRLVPPHVSNYILENFQTVFSFFDNGVTYPPNYFTIDDIFVYANGQRIRTGYDFNFDFVNNRIILLSGIFANGTYISITSLKYTGSEYDYYIANNILYFSSVQPLSTVRVVTFNANDRLFMETERYAWNPSRRFKFIRPIIDDNYVWVYANGIPLVHRYDFVVLADQRTVELADRFSFENSPEIVITSLQKPEGVNRLYGYRIFNDFYNRSSYKRLSRDHTTFLTEYLNEESNSIKLFEDFRLSPANAAKNIPGVALIDRERIEFFSRGDGFVSDLRRGTLGTSPSYTSEPGTRVVDQGIQQTVPGAFDTVYYYSTLTTNTTTYIIPLFTATTSGSYGMTLDLNVNLSDQINVLFGGKPLYKTTRYMYNDATSTELLTIGPDFYISTSSPLTQQIQLNIGDKLQSNVKLEIIHRKGKIWTGTESLLTSNVRQTTFIREKEADLPDTYFYGGDPRLLDGNFEPITNEFGKILRIE